MSNETEIGEEDEDGASSLTINKEHYFVWAYFDKSVEDGARKATCIACGKKYCANRDAGTSNMKRHIPKCFNLDEPGPLQKRAPLDQAMYRE